MCRSSAVVRLVVAYSSRAPIAGFSTQIWVFRSPSGSLGLILTNPVKPVFFDDMNLAISYSKSNNIINIYSGHYSVRMRSSGEKVLISV